jgi:hypothetical protein
MKTSWKNFEMFAIRYWLDNEMGNNPGKLRLGQAFMNKFYPEIADPEVYYEVDNDRAWVLIVERYREEGDAVISTLESGFNNDDR